MEAAKVKERTLKLKGNEILALRDYLGTPTEAINKWEAELRQISSKVWGIDIFKGGG